MLERLIQLEENLVLLQTLREEHAVEQVLEDRRLQWSLRYGLIESIQIVVDISCHLCGKYNLGAPKNYADCLRLLAQFGYFPKDLLPEFSAVVGLRNLIIHEYVRVDMKLVYSFLENLEIFRTFARAVRDRL